MRDQNKTKEQLIDELIDLRKRANADSDRILNLSHDLICVASSDGFLKYVNPAWKMTLGYTEEELLSKPFLNFIHPDDHHKSDYKVQKFPLGEQAVGLANFPFCVSDGTSQLRSNLEILE